MIHDTGWEGVTDKGLAAAQAANLAWLVQLREDSATRVNEKADKARGRAQKVLEGIGREIERRRKAVVRKLGQRQKEGIAP